MEPPALFVLLLVSWSPLHVVSSQTAAASGNNGAPEQKVPVNDPGLQPTSGSIVQEQAQIPISDTDATTGKAMDSMSGCRDLCDSECDNVPVECEYVMDSIPVMCDNDIEGCKEGCERFCLCQYNCGCRVAEGCDDSCSEECVVSDKPAIIMQQATTKAAEVVEKGNGGGGLPVVYRKESSEEEDD